uniref:Uncharacterized protein n=1 Tax=Seriola dumerili TaxID=41447 RepID=A0A3B4V8V8_SERDU
MALPFTGFELTFIIVAFIIFSLFSLASVCIQPEGAQLGEIHSFLFFGAKRRKQRKTEKLRCGSS